MILQYENSIPINLPSCNNNIHLECTDKNHDEDASITKGNVLLSSCEYLSTSENFHHYTNGFLFNKVLPIISQLLHITFSQNEYVLHPYDTYYDYHTPINDKRVTVYSSLGNKLQGLSASVLRDPNKHYLPQCPGRKTPYQTLYTFTHRCSTILNLSTATNRVILINSDSMIIPLIPLLALYFKVTIVMDNRESKSYRFLYEPFQNKITDYLCVLQTPNIVCHKEFTNLR